MPEHDESKGYWITRIVVKESAKGTIDNVTKFAYADSDYEEVTEWVEYTHEELAERAADEERIKETEAQQQWLEQAPAIQAATDAALCGLYEQTLDQEEAIASQDGAICAIFEMMEA